ncbi:MAG: translocation/assembly module TamB [Spirochaetaceae bacterium]
MSIKNNLILSHIVQLISLTIVIILFFFVINPGITELQKILSEKKFDIIRELEEEYEVNISYESISPIIIDSINIKNVSIQSFSGLQKIDISEVAIKFSLLNMLLTNFKSDNPPLIISSIHLKTGKIFIDFEDVDFFSKFKAGKPNNILIKPKIYIKNIDLDMNFELLVLKLDNIKGHLSSRMSKYYADIDTTITYESKLDVPFEYITGDAEVKAVLERNFIDLVSKVKLSNIYSDIGTIKDIKADLTLLNGELRIDKIDKKMDLTFIYKIPLYEMFFSIDSKSMGLEDLFVPDSTFNLFDKFDGTVFSGELSGLYSLMNRSFLYNSEGNISIPHLIKQIPLKLDFKFIGDLDYITINRLNTYTSKGYLGFNGGINLKTLFPQGNFYVRDFKLSENSIINSDFEVKVINSNFINVNFDYIESLGLKINDISSLLYIDENDISFQAISRDSGGKISLSGNYSKKENYISSSLNVQNLGINFLTNILDNDLIDKYFDNNKISFNANLNYDFNNIFYRINDFSLLDSEDNTYVELEGMGNLKEFSIENLKINIPDIEIQARIDGKVRGSEISLKIDSLINDNIYIFDLNYGHDKISITGSYGLKLDLVFGDYKYLNIEANNIPINYRGITVNPRFKIRTAILDDNSFLLSIPYFETSISHEKLIFDPFISFSADGSQEHLKLTSFRYIDKLSSLSGNIDLKKESNDNYYLNLLLSNEELESYDIKSLYSLSTKSLTVDLDIRNFLVDRLQLENVSGKVSTKFNMNGNRLQFKVNGTMSSNDLTINTKTTKIDLGFNITEKLFTLHDLQTSIDNMQFNIPLLTYNFIDGDILGRVDSIITLGESKLTTDIAIDLSVNEIDDFFNLNSDIINTVNGKLNIGSLKNNNDELFSNKGFRLFNNPSALQIYSIDKNLKIIHNHKSGKIIAKIQKPYFAALTANGTLKDGLMNISVNDIDIDGTKVESFIYANKNDDEKLIILDDLNMRGQLNLVGPIDNPIMNGLIWIDTNIGISYITDKIDPIRANIRIKDNKFTILNTDIKIGENGLLKFNGEMLFDSWLPETILVRGKIPIANKIPLEYQYNTIICETNIYTNNLVFYYDDSGTLITGEVIIEDGEFYTKFLNSTEPVETVIEENESINNISIELAVKIGANNRLYWPYRNLPIVQAKLNPNDQVLVNYKSVNNEYSIVGKLSISEGEINYSGNPFILKEGSIELDISPEQLDPYIKLVGYKTVLDDDDRQVEVFLEYEGGFFSDFEPTFSSSDASKSEEEINRLIGVAVIGEDDDLAINAWDILSENADSILNSYLARPLEEAIKKIIGFDEVKIQTSFITNISFDAEDETGYNLSEMLNNTSITIGHFVTKDFFIKGSVGTIFEDDQLQSEVDLGLTLYSPHFQLGFNLSPKLSDFVFTPEIEISIDWVLNPGK